MLCLAELHKQPQQALQIGFFKFGNCSLICNGSSGDVAASEYSASADASSAGNRSGANCRADSAANAAASSCTTYPGADRSRAANSCAASAYTARSCCGRPFTRSRCIGTARSRTAARSCTARTCHVRSAGSGSAAWCSFS